ncbi:MAG: glycosyltransferase family 9 protein [Chloroflexi bacterium]|nr:glycosyltransferase family 9 protein [Chloroflexota bacterium]
MPTNRQRLRLALLRIFATCTPFLQHPPRRARGDGLRILVIRPDHIGDLLFATPTLRVLRKAFPDAHLAGMVGPWAKAVVERIPHFNEVIICPFPGFTRRPKGSAFAPYRMLWEWANRLRTRHFDMAIVLRFDHWWGALLAYLVGIPYRLGYAVAECEPFLTTAVPYVSQRHEVQQNLTLVAQAIRDCHRDMPQDPGHLEFFVAEQDREYIAHYLAECGVAADEAMIVIHPGAGAAVKEWQAESFAQVADAIVAHWRARIVLTGSRDDLDKVWSIYARMRGEPIVAVGHTTLGQLAALYQRSRLVIGPDCGPLHLAVAVGTPTVHLYGPVDKHKFGPWGPPERHLVLTSSRSCIPCNRLDYTAQELPDHPCVREITPEMVLDAIRKLLG